MNTSKQAKSRAFSLGFNNYDLCSPEESENPKYFKLGAEVGRLHDKVKFNYGQAQGTEKDLERKKSAFEKKLKELSPKLPNESIEEIEKEYQETLRLINLENSN